METRKCLWCGEPLRFISGKGWVHLDGRIYKTRFDFPRFCRECGRRILEGYCEVCKKQFQKEEVDDHCVLPIRNGGRL